VLVLVLVSRFRYKLAVFYILHRICIQIPVSICVIQRDLFQVERVKST